MTVNTNLVARSICEVQSTASAALLVVVVGMAAMAAGSLANCTEVPEPTTQGSLSIVSVCTTAQHHGCVGNALCFKAHKAASGG